MKIVYEIIVYVNGEQVSTECQMYLRKCKGCKEHFLAIRRHGVSCSNVCRNKVAKMKRSKHK